MSLLANIILKEEINLQQKLSLMNEYAKFDVSDNEDYFHHVVNKIKAPKSPPKVPKIFISNNCSFNCQYCGCRYSNEQKTEYCNSPEEMASIAVKESYKNGNGIFLTSAVYRNSDYTEELILKTLKLIRFNHQYNGYVHAKIMPGADKALIKEVGFLADRVSINIELPKSDGYKLIAKQKNKNNILTPMKYIDEMISSNEKDNYGRKFAKSGQTTQIMLGSMKESDKEMLSLAQYLYSKYSLKRIYYPAFNPLKNNFEYLPSVPTPLWRSRRMYQADRLIQLYNFDSNELLSDDNPFLDYDLDPKTSWALRNLDIFPVEINKADYNTLLRVPGIGVTSASRIIEARKLCSLNHENLKKIGVSLKRAVYFITCKGRYNGRNLLYNPLLRFHVSDISNNFEQMTLFEYM